MYWIWIVLMAGHLLIVKWGGVSMVTFREEMETSTAYAECCRISHPHWSWQKEDKNACVNSTLASYHYYQECEQKIYCAEFPGFSL